MTSDTSIYTNDSIQWYFYASDTLYQWYIPLQQYLYTSHASAIPLYQWYLFYLYTMLSIPVIYLYIYSLCYTYNTIPLYQWYTSVIALPQYQWYLYNLCIVPQLPVCCLQGISAPHHQCTWQIADLYSRIYISRAYLHCQHKDARLYIFRAYRDLEAKNQKTS